MNHMGSDTEEENRFFSLQKPKPWTDIYPVVNSLNAAPQLPENSYANMDLTFTDYWHYDDISENCPGINVWPSDWLNLK